MNVQTHNYVTSAFQFFLYEFNADVIPPDWFPVIFQFLSTGKISIVDSNNITLTLPENTREKGVRTFYFLMEAVIEDAEQTDNYKNQNDKTIISLLKKFAFETNWAVSEDEDT